MTSDPSWLKSLDKVGAVVDIPATADVYQRSLVRMAMTQGIYVTTTTKASRGAPPGMIRVTCVRHIPSENVARMKAKGFAA